MSLGLTLYEQETIITYNNEEKTATVYTHHPALIKKLKDYCRKFPDQYKLKANKNKESRSEEFIVPKKYITIRCPIIRSDEQKAKDVEKGKALYKNLKANKV